MHRIIYLDPEILQLLKPAPEQSTDPEVIETVKKAIENLDSNLRQVIHERYFEGLTLAEMAERSGVEEREIAKSIYEANRQLKIALTDFVAKRWGVKPRGICRICGHPKRASIEKILLTFKSGDSWARISREIESAVDEKFHPPQILKAHLKHISNTRRKDVK